MNNLLEVKNLKLHFPVESGWLIRKKTSAIRAVDDVSFSIAAGETLGLVGESGCGKSSCARAIAQLYRPTAGEVIFENRELTKLNKQELMTARKNLQFIFQDPYASLNPRLTVQAIIAEPLLVFRELLGLTRKDILAQVAALMEDVGLSPVYRNRYPHEFSGGQRQRIGIARALALNPKLLLADEPVSALDVSVQAQILNLMQELQQKHKLAYLFIAHDLAVIKYVSDRIAVMYLGKIMELADARELYQHPLHPYTQALLSAAPIPDPVIERKRQRIILSGDVPSPDHERTSCYFYDRCSFRMEKCRVQIPQLTEMGDKHSVACFLHSDVLLPPGADN